MRLVIIGAPASGKSRLTDLLMEAFPGTASFGVRRYFARQVEAGTALGRAAAPFIAEQSWIPDEIVASAVAYELDNGNLGGSFILEGMPGNGAQAPLLDELLTERGLRLDAAVHVDTPFELCAQRASLRLVCEVCDGGSHQARIDPDGRCTRCGTPVSRRATDQLEPFVSRLDQYTEIESGLLSYYAETDRLVALDGRRPVPQVFAECLARVRLANLQAGKVARDQEC